MDDRHEELASIAATLIAGSGMQLADMDQGFPMALDLARRLIAVARQQEAEAEAAKKPAARQAGEATHRRRS